ncbi:MAG TPA: acetyl-CoA carboxylase biotin carboxyl carrier protein [Dissulfurispiraceae bacterium]|nr:acetyl-CoA carboxylase biotin carboxyl carrier protein [Dissulfurispiraceae bacterium]
MELDEIKELMGLLKETDITEVQIEKEGIKLKIKREKHYGHAEMPHVVVTAPKEEAAQPAAEDKAPTRHYTTVTAPIVGTFYLSAAPDASPFVEVGSRVKKGQILCIIEAMKLMNEIESDVDGVVAKILVENSNSVQYGQPIFLVEPA